MKTPGEKGKCLSCKYCSSPGGDWQNAWCMQKNMRFLCGPKVDWADVDLPHGEIKEKYKGAARKILENKVNPSWCPLRNEESK